MLANVGAKKAKIQKRLGQRLDSDDLQSKFWPVTKDGQRVGTAASHLAVKASRVVALGVKKLLVAYDELNTANR